jgi:glycolate oxidase FAD binding subunit
MSRAVGAAEELFRLAPGARNGRQDDLIDGAMPEYVVEPETPEAVAAILRWCSAHGQLAVMRGGGTRMSWGRAPRAVDVAVSTSRLSQVTRYEPGDLTVTVEAGLSIDRLNRELAGRGQWLPIDVPSGDSTVGGAIATNESGPLRHRYGTPRDLLIGIRLATADGRLASAGGQVVKNVAGYDLGKLMAGSFGTLAAIVSATFKLAPRPAASETMAWTFPTGEALAAAAGAIGGSQIDLLSLETEAILDGAAGHERTFRLLARFGGTASANAEQAAETANLVAPFGPTANERLADEADGEFWRDRPAAMWRRPGALVRASWLPSRLGDVVALLEEIARRNRSRVRFEARAAVGAGTVSVDGDVQAQRDLVEALRARPDVAGNVLIMRAGPDVKAVIDVWGPPTGAAVVAAALKRALDPASVLNASRGPV